MALDGSTTAKLDLVRDQCGATGLTSRTKILIFGYLSGTKRHMSMYDKTLSGICNGLAVPLGSCQQFRLGKDNSWLFTKLSASDSLTNIHHQMLDAFQECIKDHYASEIKEGRVKWWPRIALKRHATETDLKAWLTTMRRTYPAGFELGNVTGFNLYHLIYTASGEKSRILVKYRFHGEDEIDEV
ncbi:uncharacterized protein LY89DRAFT_278452 [Mollisia scopiformis]|uniref:Uncharacterized protein n=1 Tax=Mollisia scopiformis TaxID=149040 RepID=A0A132BBN9_MOLSC|nr:uncharacterized protein LY89DRAFT_278452 [Mollisia scopiformis]KUJ09842.1 hypothetical protein LY89DRAFT_278452 [Mollisia scopiformis]